MSVDLAEIMILFLGGYFITSVIATLFPSIPARVSKWVFNRLEGK